MTPEGGRVLGCLVEKRLTTPQQYPLTLNALQLACNQTTNREPVMALDERAVERALQELKELRLVRFVLPSHGKSVTRYRHVFDEVYGLETDSVALLAVLLLRGPQTPGELRARTGRMTEFESLSAVQADLEALAQRPEPLVRLLPRQPGQKEDRWRQILTSESTEQPLPPGSQSMMTSESAWAGPGPNGAESPDDEAPLSSESSTDEVGLPQRVDDLEVEVRSLRDRISELDAELNDLRDSLGGR